MYAFKYNNFVYRNTFYLNASQTFKREIESVVMLIFNVH